MRHTWLLALALTACWVDDDAVFDAQDRDGDGYLPVSVGGDDCDNADPSVHPDAVEICGDGIDNNCDLAVDDNGEGAVTFFRDTDDDGWGDASDTIEACTVPTGYAAQAGDCAPEDPNRSPGARDLCNGIDDDCDGQIDEDATVSSWYYDADGDGFGANSSAVQSCESPGNGWTTQGDDCDDLVANINPVAPDDNCNGIDNDCDGQADEDSTYRDWFLDADGDGWGAGSPTHDCIAPSSEWVRQDGDCDDTMASTNPVALDDDCDGVDDDCSGAPDQNATYFSVWADADGDGAGDPSAEQQVCAVPSGYVIDHSDCDDQDGSWIDTEYYADTDGDGYGDPLVITRACATPPSGYVVEPTDCDDSTQLANPSQTEVCSDGLDNDCNGGSAPCGLEGANQSDSGYQLFAINSSQWWAINDGDGDGLPDLVYDPGNGFLLLLQQDGDYIWNTFSFPPRPTGSVGYDTSVTGLRLQGYQAFTIVAETTTTYDGPNGLYDVLDTYLALVPFAQFPTAQIDEMPLSVHYSSTVAQAPDWLRADVCSSEALVARLDHPINGPALAQTTSDDDYSHSLPRAYDLAGVMDTNGNGCAEVLAFFPNGSAIWVYEPADLTPNSSALPTAELTSLGSMNAEVRHSDLADLLFVTTSDLQTGNSNICVLSDIFTGQVDQVADFCVATDVIEPGSYSLGDVNQDGHPDFLYTDGTARTLELVLGPLSLSSGTSSGTLHFPEGHTLQRLQIVDDPSSAGIVVNWENSAGTKMRFYPAGTY